MPGPHVNLRDTGNRETDPSPRSAGEAQYAWLFPAALLRRRKRGGGGRGRFCSLAHVCVFTGQRTSSSYATRRRENQRTRNKSQGQVLEGTGGAGILDSREGFHLQRGQAFASAAGGGGDGVSWCSAWGQGSIPSVASTSDKIGRASPGPATGFLPPTGSPLAR